MSEQPLNRDLDAERANDFVEHCARAYGDTGAPHFVFGCALVIHGLNIVMAELGPQRLAAKLQEMAASMTEPGTVFESWPFDVTIQ